MKKKGYGARKRRDTTKGKDIVRRCYKCKSTDHLIAECPLASNDEDNNKKRKKTRKRKKIRR
jgi:hypothetical protein